MKLYDLLLLGDNKKNLDDIRKNRETIIPFIGAGVSAAYGLPTWNELLDKLAFYYLQKNQRVELSETLDYLEYAQKIVDNAGNFNMVVNRIRTIYSECNIGASKLAYQLLNSFSNNLVTTNYDLILEQSSDYLDIKNRIKVLLPSQPEQMTEAIRQNDICILKMHGTIEESSSIVLTKEQYNIAYGYPDIDLGKAVPNFLSSIFYGKSVLFVGCSLKQDRTMDVLSSCLDNNPYIKNYAIVEMPYSENEQIQQRRYLEKLGIIPIYFPKGEYNSLELLMNYLAEDNMFIIAAKQILKKYINKSDANYDLLCSLLNESYYETAKIYPDILNFDIQVEELIEIMGAHMEKEKLYKSLYSICVNMFQAFACTGLMPTEDIKKFLISYFSDAILRETEIKDLLMKKHNIYTIEELNIAGKNNAELTELADNINRKIQFENERDYSNFYKNYAHAIQLLDMAYDRIEIHQRIILCNTVGAYFSYVLETYAPKKYLERAIDDILSLKLDKHSKAILSKCYCNLGLIYAAELENYNNAIKCAKKDIELKLEICDNKRLIAGSYGNLALFEKEVLPFNAVNTYFNVIDMKRENIEISNQLRYERDKNESSHSMRKKLISSWATSIFDISLLAKDLLLYETASKFLNVANQYRSSLISENNKDYLSSLNVATELNIYLNEDQNMELNIKAIESRINFDPKLVKTLYHSYYVCALYFYRKKDYQTSLKYLRRFYMDYSFNNNIRDTRQEARAANLKAKILLKQGNIELAKYILDDIITRMIKIYGDESFWLMPLVRCYKKIDIKAYNGFNFENEFYKKQYEANIALNDYYNKIINNLPEISSFI